MHSGTFVFSQVMERVPHCEFQRVARRHGVDSPKLGFTAWEHFSAMAFAQLTFRERLREIEACPRSQRSFAYHLGFRRVVRRSTLAYPNEHRDWCYFAELAQRMMQLGLSLYREEPIAVDVAGDLYALDATMIDLNLALCPWANWTGTDVAVKMHTMLDLRGPLPPFGTINRWQRRHPLNGGYAKPGHSTTLIYPSPRLPRLSDSNAPRFVFPLPHWTAPAVRQLNPASLPPLDDYPE